MWCDWIERDGTRGGGAPGCGDEEAAWAWAWADHAGGGSGWLDAFAGLAYTGAAAGPGLAAATFPAWRGVPCVPCAAAAGVAWEAVVGCSGVPGTGTAAPLPTLTPVAALSLVRTRTTGLAGTGGAFAAGLPPPPPPPPPLEDDCRLGQAGARAATAAAFGGAADPEELRRGVVVCGGAAAEPAVRPLLTELFRPALWTEPPPGLPGDGGGGGIGDWDMIGARWDRSRYPPRAHTERVIYASFVGRYLLSPSSIHVSLSRLTEDGNSSHVLCRAVCGSDNNNQPVQMSRL